MAQSRPLAGHRALVTGASSGIGAAIARELGSRGAALTLVARRQDRLQALGASLRDAYAVDVATVGCDLSGAGSASQLWRGLPPEQTPTILINNAGFGYFRPFTHAELDRDLEMIQLNIASVVELAHLFVSHHLQATPSTGRAYLMNVASTAAFQAVPNFAVYASTKHFVRNFSEALYYELRTSAIAVHCLCPGGTTTEFHSVAGAGNYGALANMSMLSAEAVARHGVEAMLRGKKTLVTGILNKIAALAAKLSPSGLAAQSTRLVMGRPRAEPLPMRALPQGPEATR